MTRYIQNAERKNNKKLPHAQILYWQSYHSELKDNFPEKQKQKEFITTKLVLQEMLKDPL